MNMFEMDMRDALNIVKNDEISFVEFEKYRGLSFEEFWKALPKKLEYTDYEAELADILELSLIHI